MAKNPAPEAALVADVSKRLDELRSIFPNLSRQAKGKTTVALAKLAAAIDDTRAELDLVKDPGPAFDPNRPETAGQLVALALLAQDKVPLGEIARAYGSGVYAIYYVGGHPAYAAVSNTETPLYVGKADPEMAGARSPREQGVKLFARLSDHRKMIKTVGTYCVVNGLPNPLRIEDFLCRRLVCATNSQLVAERHLIGTFRPVWNSEVGIAFGISKHGDAAKTRANKRSPWDVLHLGRRWAMDSVEDQMPEAEILRKLEEHFVAHPPFQDRDLLVRAFLNAFKQNAPITTADIAAAEDEAQVDQGGLV